MLKGEEKKIVYPLRFGTSSPRLGHSLQKPICGLASWALDNVETIHAAQARFDASHRTRAEAPLGFSRQELQGASPPRMLKPVTTDIEALKTLDERLRWLSAWTIHHANHVRESADGLKVGGHQASCASMTAIMAALYFHALGPNDRVAVKPHAGPVLHAIHYLLGSQSARGAREFPRIRRRAELSEPDQGQDSGRFLHRLGRARRRHHALRQPRAGLSHRPRPAGRGRTAAALSR